MSKIKKKQNANIKKLNKIESVVLWEFKKTKFYTLIISILILIMTVIYGIVTEFDSEILKDLSVFSMNIVLVIAALSIAIFSIPFHGELSERKKDIIIRYVGEIVLTIVIILLGYTISFFGSFFSNFVIKVYSELMLLVLLRSITRLLAAIVMYFDLKE